MHDYKIVLLADKARRSKAPSPLNYVFSGESMIKISTRSKSIESVSKELCIDNLQFKCTKLWYKYTNEQSRKVDSENVFKVLVKETIIKERKQSDHGDECDYSCILQVVNNIRRELGLPDQPT